MTDTGDATQVKKKMSRADERQEQIKNDLISIMDTAHGRRFIWRLLESAHVYTLSYTGEVNGTMFQEGERNIGLKTLALVLSYCPKLYGLMSEEHAPVQNKDKNK